MATMTINSGLNYVSGKLGRIIDSTKENGLPQTIKNYSKVTGFEKDLKLRFPDFFMNRQAAAARKRGMPSILLCMLPKSASAFIALTLEKQLGLPMFQISACGHLLEARISEQNSRRFAKGGILGYDHFPAHKLNLMILRHTGVNKIIVHMRDPRQALLSWMEYLKNRGSNHQDHLYTLEYYGYPPDLISLPFSEQMDLHIEKYHKLQIEWITQWVDARESSESGLQILLTTFENFKEDPNTFFKSLLEFYDVDPALFKSLPKKESHFRKGEVEEWRRVLTPEQVEKVNHMVPDRILETFDWKR